MGLSTADVAVLDLRTKLVLMRTAAHSLKILHDLRIVRGDLKPSNILIKRTELGYTTKLIDFDNAYIAGSPAPARGDRRHDQLLLSRTARVHPRRRCDASRTWGGVRRVRPRAHLHRIPTGAPPPFDTATHHEPAVAVRSGETLRIPRAATPIERPTWSTG